MSRTTAFTFIMMCCFGVSAGAQPTVWIAGGVGPVIGHHRGSDQWYVADVAGWVQMNGLALGVRSGALGVPLGSSGGRSSGNRESSVLIGGVVTTHGRTLLGALGLAKTKCSGCRTTTFDTVSTGIRVVETEGSSSYALGFELDVLTLPGRLASVGLNFRGILSRTGTYVAPVFTVRFGRVHRGA